MQPTRHTQPHRRHQRHPSIPLSAMLRGATLDGFNPADIQRRTMTGKGLVGALRRRSYPQRRYTFRK